MLTGENWNEIMIEAIMVVDSMTSPTIFFILMIIIGNYMLLNLFLAILLKFISENSESAAEALPEKATSEEVTRKQSEKRLKPELADSILNHNPDDDLNESNAFNSSNSSIGEELKKIKE